MMVSVKREELARIKRANARMRNENQVLRCTLKNLERNPYLECKEVLKAISNFCCEHYRSERTRRGPLGPPYTCPDDCPPCPDDRSNNWSNNSGLLKGDPRSCRPKSPKSGSESSRSSFCQPRLYGDNERFAASTSRPTSRIGDSWPFAGEGLNSTDMNLFLDEYRRNAIQALEKCKITQDEDEEVDNGRAVLRDAVTPIASMIDLARYE